MLRNAMLALAALVATIAFMAWTIRFPPAPPPAPPDAVTTRTAPPQASPTPSTTKQAEDHKASQRYIAAKLVADGIRKLLNDPDSLRWDDLYTDESGTVVCAQYRARNAFNGMVRKYASFTRNGASETILAWNKSCVGSGFFNERYVVGLR